MDGKIFCTRCGSGAPLGALTCQQCGARLVIPSSMSGDSTIPTVSPSSATPYSPPAMTPVVAGAGYGGFWIRFVALVLDVIIVNIIIFVSHILGPIGFVLGIVGNWIYEAMLESSVWQATLGKKLLGLRVTDLYGNRISFARATARHFAKYLSGLMLCIGYVMAGFTARKQALHDILAGTLVWRT